MKPINVRLVLALWIVILAVIGIRVVGAKRSNSVYPIFATAGEAWAKSENIYRDPTAELDQYRYSPTVAAFFAAADALPRSVGEVLWRVLNAAVLLGGLVAWGRWQRTQNVGALALLVVPLAIGGLNNGQCNALIGGLLLYAQVWFDRERWWAAAAAVTVCFLLKEYPLALGLLFCLIEPRRFTPRLLVCLIAGLAAPFLLQNFSYVVEQYRNWFLRALHDDRTQFVVGFAYRDLHLLFRNAGVPLTLMQYRVLELVLAFGIAVWIAIKSRQGDRFESIWAAGALAACWMTLAGPATESPTYVLLAPLLAISMLDAPHAPRWSRWLTVASFSLFTLAAMIVWFPTSISRPVHATGIQPFAALLLTVVAMERCGRRKMGREQSLLLAA